MNKTELINVVAERTGATKKDTEAVINAFTETVTEALANGDKVQIVGFGTFETRHRAARTARNIQTGEVVQVPEKRVPAFKAGSKLKEVVRG